MTKQILLQQFRPTVWYSLFGYDADAMGGGKGALIQKDKSGTLSCNNDQTLIILNDQGGAFMSISKDVTATLRAEIDGHPPVVCFDPKWLSPSDTATAIMGENAKDNPVVCYETYHMTGGALSNIEIKRL